MRDRAAMLARAATRRYDVAVVGGGINGAGIARDAAERGLRVLLVERDDWGFGTTWRSTKLIHGGLRYLEHGEIGLVAESLHERAVLLRTAPHLVRPMPFLLPNYRGDRHRPATLRLGAAVYDVLALGGGLPRHRAFDATGAMRLEPRLRRRGLRGALGYWDAQVALPERLCLENVLRAGDAGAETLSYVEAIAIETERGRVRGLRLRDTVTGTRFTAATAAVVNAAGPWVDRVLDRSPAPGGRLGGTRGIHLVVRFANGGPRRAVYAEAAGDGRPFFVVPWRGLHLVGTTDIPVSSPDADHPTADEVQYLIEATASVLPGDPITGREVLYAYGGVRPLPRSSGLAAGAITRRHHIVDHGGEGARGLFSVIGGKLSTYRSLAAQATDRVVRITRADTRPSRTARAPLVPGAWRPATGCAEQARLYAIYGPAAGRVAERMQASPDAARPLCVHVPDVVAQVDHAVEAEGAVTVADVLLRRTPAGWAECLGLDAAPAVAEQMGLLLGWTDAGVRAAVTAYEHVVADTFWRPRYGFD
jgi:glycerol-3-phosphate dehydrogenase